MKDVKIENREKWQDRHWKTIAACYNKSPWLDHYRDDLERLFQKKQVFLVDWNMQCFEWICAKMAISPNVELSQQPLALEDGIAIDFRRHFTPSSIDRMNPSPDSYPQVFGERHGFIPNLSILDRLFCAGNRL